MPSQPAGRPATPGLGIFLFMPMRPPCDRQRRYTVRQLGCEFKPRRISAHRAEAFGLGSRLRKILTGRDAAEDIQLPLKAPALR